MNCTLKNHWLRIYTERSNPDPDTLALGFWNNFRRLVTVPDSFYANFDGIIVAIIKETNTVFFVSTHQPSTDYPSTTNWQQGVNLSKGADYEEWQSSNESKV